MATDWLQEQIDAYNDIKDDGVAIRIVQTTAGTYNPVTDAVSGGGTIGYPTYAINIQFKDLYNSDTDQNRAWPTNIKMGDRLILIPGYQLPDLSNAGSLDDYEVEYVGYNNNVVYTQSVEPGGVPVLFRMQLRRKAIL